MSNREIAKEIATALMTAGNKEKADRLVLLDRSNRDLGGWGELGLISQIEKLLDQEQARDATSTRCCSNCAYSRQSAGGDLYCHATPPRPTGDLDHAGENYWPMVKSTDWCAAFSRRATEGDR